MAGIIAETLWTSGAPVMTYPLYAAHWGLTPLTTAALYAVFPIVVGVLSGSGNVSDFIGRRPTMLWGHGSSLCGVALSAVAPNVWTLFAGRVCMGLGVGLTAGAASAALLEFSSAANATNSSSVTTAAQSLGFVLATLVGGTLVQFAPSPTRLTFFVLCAYIVLLIRAASLLPSTFSTKREGTWRPHGLDVPPGMRRPFAISALAGVISYMIGALLLSVGAQTTRDLIGSRNAMVNRAALALFPIVFGSVSIAARRLCANSALAMGGTAVVASMILMTIAALNHSLADFLAATAAAGISFGLLLVGALTLINTNAPVDRRGGSLSALYLVAYLCASDLRTLARRANEVGRSRERDRLRRRHHRRARRGGYFPRPLSPV